MENLHPDEVAEAPEGNHGGGPNQIDLEENSPAKDEPEPGPGRSVGQKKGCTNT